MEFRKDFGTWGGLVTFYSKDITVVTLPGPYSEFQRLKSHCKESTKFLMHQLITEILTLRSYAGYNDYCIVNDVRNG